MIKEDPDQDILDALSWREQRLQIVHVLIALAAGALTFFAVFALMARVLAAQTEVSLDSAAIAGIGLGSWLMLRLNKRR